MIPNPNEEKQYDLRKKVPSKDVTRLSFRVNDKHSYDLYDPFDGTGLTPSILSGGGELTEDEMKALLDTLVSKHNLDVSRIEKVELTGFWGKPPRPN